MVKIKYTTRQDIEREYTLTFETQEQAIEWLSNNSVIVISIGFIGG